MDKKQFWFAVLVVVGVGGGDGVVVVVVFVFIVLTLVVLIIIILLLVLPVFFITPSPNAYKCMYVFQAENQQRVKKFNPKEDPFRRTQLESDEVGRAHVF